VRFNAAAVPDLVLLPEEEAVIARAIDKRRREFTTARVRPGRAGWSAAA
jgi:4'-phosphopantetheinyl transferase EntD